MLQRRLGIIRFLLTSVLLGWITVVAPGCYFLATTVDKEFIQEDDISLAVDRINEDCPRRINSYTTLVGVDYRFGDVQFNYRVGEAGRERRDADVNTQMENLVLREAIDPPMRELITEKELRTLHRFRDWNNWPALGLGFNLDHYDVRRIEHEKLDDLEITSAMFPSDPYAGKYEDEIAKLKSRTSKRRLKALFDSVNEECPKPLNDYATLEKVVRHGKTIFEFHYELEPGSEEKLESDMNDGIVDVMAETLNDTPHGDAILKFDLRVKHIFKRYDGKHLLYVPTSRNELMRVRLQEPEEADFI